MATPVGDSYTVASGLGIYGGRIGPGAGTGITLVDFALDYQGFQHVNGSKDVPVSANYTGNPSILQARVLDDDTGLPVTDWKTFATNPASSPASGVHQVPGQLKFYRMQVRDGVNPALVSTGTKRFGVGVCGVDWGQSNMANRISAYGPLYPLSSKFVRMFNPSTQQFQRVGNYNDALAPNTLAASYGSNKSASPNSYNGEGTVFFANLLSAALNMPVFILNRAVGGSMLSSWVEDGVPGVDNNWDSLKTSLNTAFGGDFEFARGMIGETDAGEFTQAQQEAKFALVHAQFKALNGRNDSNFKFILSSLGPGSFQGSAEGDFGVQRLALTNYAQSNAGAILGTCYHDTRTGTDTVHINGEGFGRGERREAKSYLAAKGIGTTAAGPRITGATRAGLDVTFTIQHTGGTALMDGAGGTGTALTGFQFNDAGAAGGAIGYTATAILSATTFRVTLASEPVGQLTARYGLMNVPHGTADDPKTLVLASVLCDNALAYSLTVGSPLQPCAAFTVS